MGWMYIFKTMTGDEIDRARFMTWWGANNYAFNLSILHNRMIEFYKENNPNEVWYSEIDEEE